MSLYLGSKLLSGVATDTISNAHSLLDFKWSDHILNEMSWLRADTFSWHNGLLYKGAYNHLVEDVNGKSADNSDTIGSYTIWYVLADDGHKIVGPDQETIANNIYNESGVSWYYILDKTNKRFKLPRTKWGFVGLRDTVGKYIPESVPNHMHYVSRSADISNESVTSEDGGSHDTVSRNAELNTSYLAPTTLASYNNSAYQDNAPVQQRSTQMYLYFYVGEYSQSQAEQVATLDIELFNSKADKDLVNTGYLTNCITEIPQDVKLELNDGTLTLKAGSKVYVPNGFESDGVTPKFDVVITNTDITPTGWANLTGVVVITNNGSGYNFTGLSQCTSGTTEAAHSDGNLWYDTANNIMKRWDGASVTTWTTGYSLPIAIVTSNGTAQTSIAGIKSIDQVFNGFGYIGNTKFVLPGVKGLNPNGRNEDGTLNNTLITTETVLTITGSSTDTVIGYFNSNSLNNHSTTTFIYDEELNLIVRTSDKKSYKEIYGEGKIPYTNTYHQTNGKIDFCTFHKVFHALDYNDKSTVSGWGMPSDVYEDMATTTYTATANGWAFFQAASGTNGGWVNIVCNDGLPNYRQVANRNATGTHAACLVMPVRKGETVTCGRENNGTIYYNRFIYAEGEV